MIELGHDICLIHSSMGDVVDAVFEEFECKLGACLGFYKPDLAGESSSELSERCVLSV